MSPTHNYDDHREPPSLRSFASEIAEATGCAPEDVDRVARLMEDELGPIALIHPDAFRDHARRLYRYLLSLREMARKPDASAGLLGWTRAEFDEHVERHLGGY